MFAFRLIGVHCRRTRRVSWSVPPESGPDRYPTDPRSHTSNQSPDKIVLGLARCVVRRTRFAPPAPVSVNGSLCTFAIVVVCRIVAFDSDGGGGFNGGDYAQVLAPLVAVAAEAIKRTWRTCSDHKGLH